LRLRSPAVLTIIGVAATVVVVLMVVITLRLTAGAKAVSDNAVLISALVVLGGVFTSQMVNSTLEDRRAQQVRETEQAQRHRDLDQQRKDGQQQPSGGLWAAGIFWVALVFLLIVIGGYIQEWKWTGLPKQTLWDWLDLLIVPAVLAVGGYLFTRSESQRTLQSSNQQREVDREVAKEQAETDREIADQRRQDDTLQAYLDQIGQLLLDKDRPLRQSKKDDEVQTLARARTLTVLASLEGPRKASVVQFLYESNLIAVDHLVLDLSEAALSGADLSSTALSGAHLSTADLSEAHLSRADLSEAHLMGAHLSGANLSKADLSGARGWTDEQLRAAGSLEGATMPDGRTLRGDKMPTGPTFEDWLKDKKTREEGE
jgi:uncharacterized protein YjbI with pentapeptide repeats